MSRYVSNESIARMQARYAHLGGPVKNENSAGIKRRQRNTSGIQSAAADLHETVSEAIDLSSAALRRQQQVESGAARNREQDSRRASALDNPRAVRS